MSIALMTYVWKTDIPATKKMVLLALADNANDEGTDCFPSVKTLSVKCTMSDRAIQGHLSALEDDGILTRRFNNGRSTNYCLNASLIEKMAKEAAALRKQKRAEIYPQDSNSTPEESAPLLWNPHSVATPEESAGVKNLHQAPEESAPSPEESAPSPEESAPITTTEPSIKHNNYERSDLKGSGSSKFKVITNPDFERNASVLNLRWPKFSEEDIKSVSRLLEDLENHQRQPVLDEIAGAYRSGGIRGSLVAFASGVIKNAKAGRFTQTHFAKEELRQVLTEHLELSQTELMKTPGFNDVSTKGKALLDRIGKKF